MLLSCAGLRVVQPQQGQALLWHAGTSSSSHTACVQAPAAGSSQALASLRVQQALEAITRLSKGFSLSLCTRSRPKLGALLQQPLQTALQLPLVSPEHGCRLQPVHAVAAW